MQLLFYCRASSAASNIKICSQYLHQREGCFSYMTDTDVLDPRWQVLGPGSVILHSLPSSTRLLLSLCLSPHEPLYLRSVKIEEGGNGQSSISIT